MFIPVGSSDENIEGLLFLERDESGVFHPEEAELLTAIGRQLGIAAENLSAFDSLLRQTQNLQTIFEGIPEPLLLLDTGNTIIMANTAATHLAEELAEGSTDKNILEQLLEIRHDDPPHHDPQSSAIAPRTAGN